jgi:hypothetical protein
MLIRTQSGIHGASGVRGRFSKVADPQHSSDPRQCGAAWIPIDLWCRGGVVRLGVWHDGVI